MVRGAEPGRSRCRFRGTGVSWGPYRTFRQLATEDPRCLDGQPDVRHGEPAGGIAYPTPGVPARFQFHRPPAAPAGARLGQHTDEILADCSASPARDRPAARQAHRRGARSDARKRLESGQAGWMLVLVVPRFRGVAGAREVAEWVVTREGRFEDARRGGLGKAGPGSGRSAGDRVPLPGLRIRPADAAPRSISRRLRKRPSSSGYEKDTIPITRPCQVSPADWSPVAGCAFVLRDRLPTRTPSEARGAWKACASYRPVSRNERQTGPAGSDGATPPLTPSAAAWSRPCRHPRQRDRCRCRRAAPQGVHWLLAPPRAPLSELGPDGHPRRGNSCPRSKRRAACGQRATCASLNPSPSATRSHALPPSPRSTRARSSGPLVFVGVDHVLRVDGETCVEEHQTLVFRDIQPYVSPAQSEEASAPADFERRLTPDPVMLFRLSGRHLQWPSHPLRRTLRHQRRALSRHRRPRAAHGEPLPRSRGARIRRDRLSRFSFRGVSPAFANEPLRLAGTRRGDELAFTASAAGRIVARASAKLWAVVPEWRGGVSLRSNCCWCAGLRHPLLQ